MLGDKDASANIAVRDLERAKRFYGETLGLTQVGSEGTEVIVFRSGNTVINIYQSKYAGTNQATALTWVVGDDVQGFVKALKSKGVSFEHYDMPDVAREGDVHIGGNMKIAWFKDPDGNILNIISR